MCNIKNSRTLFKNFAFFFLKRASLFILKGQNGVYVLKMPRIFFLNFFSSDAFSLIFLNNYHFQSFLKLFNTYYNRLFAFFFFSLVLKGGGFRIKRFCKIFISYDFCILRNLITYILLIKAVTAYRKRGFHYKRMLFLRKKGKKRI